MGVVAAIAAVASAAIAAGSAIHQGEVQSNYAKYQQDQAQADALAKQQAAQVEAERIRKAGQQQRSQAIAALAGSGVNVDSTTAVRIDQTIGQNANQDAFQTIANGNNQAARLNADAVGYGQQASNALTAGYVGAAGSLLSGASRAYGYVKGST